MRQLKTIWFKIS